MRAILVSRCLLGDSCRYDGASRPCPGVSDLAGRYRLIPICPECDGGLPTPRTPSERRGDAVETKDGRDVTAAFRRGAENALRLARENDVAFALLKSLSPSCGVGKIYDGTFTRTLTEGDGVTAGLLKENGIPVYTESDLPALLSDQSPTIG